jgi:hypothetical protein
MDLFSGKLSTEKFSILIKIAQSPVHRVTRLQCQTLQEAFMGSSHFPEISCILCSQPVNLRTDLYADENGKAVHEDCYVKKIASADCSEPPIAFPPSRSGGTSFLACA